MWLDKLKELKAAKGMTAKQICAVLFPDDMDDNKNASYLRQLVMDLKNTLKSVGAENVLRHETPCYRVDTALIKCDYISSGIYEFVNLFYAWSYIHNAFPVMWKLIWFSKSYYRNIKTKS